MANYCSTIRTNYFHVKDPDAFRAFMARVCGIEEFWEKKDENGRTIFGFGAYEEISGLVTSDDEGDDNEAEASYDAFIDGLQEHIADDDAVIILEAGNEKMRYVVGSATIVTSKNDCCLDITHLAAKKAAELLENPNWTTQCEY